MTNEQLIKLVNDTSLNLMNDGEGDGTIWLPLYTLGVVIITNKINRIVRSKD
jgi:hypothetical protein